MLSPQSPSKATKSFWGRRRNGTEKSIITSSPIAASDISAPVLISRTDRNRKCVTLEDARESYVDTTFVSSSSSISPLRLNPVAASASARASATSSVVSAVSVSRSAPAIMTSRRGAISSPSPSLTYSSPSSQVSSAVSSRFSVWSESDSDMDDCLSIIGDDDELAFENVTPVSPHQSSDDLFALSLAAREELSMATCDNVQVRRGDSNSRARMAIYIPSTSGDFATAPTSYPVAPCKSSRSAFFSAPIADDVDSSDVEDEIACGQIFYPAIPEPRSVAATPVTSVSFFSGSFIKSPVYDFSQEDTDIDDVLSAYQ